MRSQLRFDRQKTDDRSCHPTPDAPPGIQVSNAGLEPSCKTMAPSFSESL